MTKQPAAIAAGCLLLVREREGNHAPSAAM